MHLVYMLPCQHALTACDITDMSSKIQRGAVARVCRGMVGGLRVRCSSCRKCAAVSTILPAYGFQRDEPIRERFGARLKQCGRGGGASREVGRCHRVL